MDDLTQHLKETALAMGRTILEQSTAWPVGCRPDGFVALHLTDEELEYEEMRAHESDYFGGI